MLSAGILKRRRCTAFFNQYHAVFCYNAFIEPDSRLPKGTIT